MPPKGSLKSLPSGVAPGGVWEKTASDSVLGSFWDGRICDPYTPAQSKRDCAVCDFCIKTETDRLRNDSKCLPSGFYFGFCVGSVGSGDCFVADQKGKEKRHDPAGDK